LVGLARLVVLAYSILLAYFIGLFGFNKVLLAIPKPLYLRDKNALSLVRVEYRE